jgi:hypothetical protein
MKFCALTELITDVTVTWNVFLFNLVHIYPSFGGTYCFQFSNLKMEASSSSEPQGTIHKIIRYRNLGDGNLQIKFLYSFFIWFYE